MVREREARGVGVNACIETVGEAVDLIHLTSLLI